MELFAQSVGPFTVLQWCIGLVAFGVLLGMWNSYSASRGETGAHGKPVLFLHPKDFAGTLIELEQA